MRKPVKVPEYVKGLSDESLRSLTVYTADYQMRPRKFIKQKGPADCVSACLATLSGIPLEEIPAPDRIWNLQLSKEESQKIWNFHYINLYCFMLRRGWHLETHPNSKPAPIGWSIGSGKSPRGDWNHGFICLNGKPYFDPYTGTKNPKECCDGAVEFYEMLRPVMEWPKPEQPKEER